MAEYIIQDTTLTDIADAIREKDGSTDPIRVSDMATAIADIPSGGDAPDIVYRGSGESGAVFSNDNLKWLVTNYPNRFAFGNDFIISKNLFINSSYTDLSRLHISYTPGTITKKHSYTGMFADCHNLRKLPTIDSDFTVLANSIEHPFAATKLSEEEILKFFNDRKFERGDFKALVAGLFGVSDNTNILKKIKERYLATAAPSETSAAGSFSNFHVGQIFDENYATAYNVPLRTAYIPIIDTPNGYPVTSDKLTQSRFFYGNAVKHLIFETNEDGTAKIVKWKNQTLFMQNDQYTCVGCNKSPLSDLEKDLLFNNNPLGLSETDNLFYGIDVRYPSAGTLEAIRARYEEVKDNPNLFIGYASGYAQVPSMTVAGNTKPVYFNVGWSNYNHDSAVETINSLPDCSAYLATAGGTNTIKFPRYSGYWTDGGAVGNLTADEIAVAANKGWTITFVD